jgi:hypothetical protein
MRVVVLGGAGNFGARIVRALRDEPSIELISAGRRKQPVPGAEAVTVVSLNTQATDFSSQLAALRPGLVIHCVGPFQGQGYHIAKASLACGAHYLDLADGREFVAGFAAALSQEAKVAGRCAISGASTLPALSSAAVDALGESMSSLERVEIAIAPGQLAPRGPATLAAVLSYLGRSFPVWRHRRWERAWGWMGLRRVRFAFARRWGAHCDVPDLGLFPQRYSTLASVTFHACLEVGLQHFALWCLAALRRCGLPLPVERWATALDRCAGIFDAFGGPFGGMRVSIVGVDASGHRLRRTWQLTAPAVHGPEIPCMAAILLARRILQGAPLPSGAFACMGFLTLQDFAPEFERHGITTAVTSTGATIAAGRRYKS